MQLKTFSEFGKELRRPFEVHENCYDCADFYDGCKGWRASRDFECAGFNRLPDVLPGTCGQRFPPSRGRSPVGPEPARKERAMNAAALAEDEAELNKRERASKGTPARETKKHGTLETTAASKVSQDRSNRAVPKAAKQARVSEWEVRTCVCGAVLPKGRRLCDACRTQNRRATMRDYMRTRRAGSGDSRPDSGIRAKRAETLSTQRCGDERRLTGLWDGSPSVLQTTV